MYVCMYVCMYVGMCTFHIDWVGFRREWCENAQVVLILTEQSIHAKCVRDRRWIVIGNSLEIPCIHTNIHTIGTIPRLLLLGVFCCFLLFCTLLWRLLMACNETGPYPEREALVETCCMYICMLLWAFESIWMYFIYLCMNICTNVCIRCTTRPA